MEDHEDAAESLKWLLEVLGQEVLVARDGGSAIEKAKMFHPEVVLLDISLPDMHGYDVARRLREESGLDGMIIAALTGWGQEDMRARSRKHGFNQHFVKPIDIDVLRPWLASLEVPHRGSSPGDDA